MRDLEIATIESAFTPPFTLTHPEGLPGPLVLSSPHSGRHYPASFLAASQLSAHALRKSEDIWVEDLFSAGPAMGASLLAARFPRAYLDVNREPYELDPLLFSEQLPDFANTRTPRVLGGLGSVARIVADGEEIYRTPPTLEQAMERIERLHKPYHATIERLLSDAAARHGFAVLVDCHSMPSANLVAAPAARRPDIILGDRFGCSCDRRLTERLQDLLENQGLRVVLNRPYAGGYITEHYGRPGNGWHALQIEINRSLYMDERAYARNRGYDRLRRRLTTALEQFTLELWDLALPRVAAE